MNRYKQRPTVCEIDLQALRNNYSIIKEKSGKRCKILAVVKADAYGHGAVEISRELERAGVDYLGVAILEEAVTLREAGIASPVLILGGLFEGQEPAIFDYCLATVIYSMDSAVRLNEEALKRGKKAKVHVKIDTGMGRLGIRPEDATSFFRHLKKLKGVEVEGVATHFASADTDPSTGNGCYTIEQTGKFKDALGRIKAAGFDIPLRHASNSAALFRFPAGYFNMARPGITLYGALPSPSMGKTEGLKGVMSLRTKIIDIRDVGKGFRVSYGSTYITQRASRIALLPVGYADGYSRALSNSGEAMVRGERANIAGRVCMDMTMIDVTGIAGVDVGDDVCLFGGNGEKAISIDELAEKTGTIPYEVMCGISPRVPRVYIR